VRNRWRTRAVVGLIGLCLIGLALGGVYYALHSEPSFYTAALAQPAPTQREAGTELERNLLALHNDAQDAATWAALFTDEQVNGWLGVDLPEKFPHLLPETVTAPRVHFAPGHVQLGCRLTDSHISSVVSATVSVQLSDEPNTLAVRIHGAWAGQLPLPLKGLLDQISAAAERAEVPLKWVQSDGDPVALITLTNLSPLDDGRRPQITRIELGDGTLRLVGQTEQ
jgi:hypothetical protein